MKPPPAVSLAGVTKRFGRALAVDDVTLDLEAGGVHAIVGENGAGKTTLVRLLAGETRPDAGTMRLSDGDYNPRGPLDARRRGVALVHQHFMLVPTLTALENAMLGDEPTRAGFLLDRGAARRRFVMTAQRFALDVAPDRLVESMSVGEKQRLEILRTLLGGARLLLLDEPTAVLTPGESRALFETVLALVKEGATIVFVTHRLAEVVRYAECVVVMRKGRVVERLLARETTEVELARLLVGREPAAFGGASRRAPGDVALRVRGLRDIPRRGERARLKGVDVEVRAGEIVGIAAVEGNGQAELVEAIAGLRAWTGEIELAGASTRGNSPGATRRRGLAHVPGDRTSEGILPEMTAEENFLLGKQRDARFSSRGVLQPDALRAFAREAITHFQIVPPEPDAPARVFSGGNQQKIVFARETEGAPRVLLAVHPARGVDVAAQETIHAALLDLRERGTAILLVSADLVELLRLADRIVVLGEGVVRAMFTRGDVDEEALGLAMTSGATAAVSR